MKNSISEARRRLLTELESIVGNSFYNGHVQNYGPGGVREADGRGLRYPVTIRGADGARTKIKDNRIPDTVPAEVLLSGYYALGANHLDVMSALNRVLQHLERSCGLSIESSS